MNWQHITYFCSCAVTQNYRKSADELFISVSALSKAISALEEELEVPLFEKNGRNVILTKYGEAFFEYAQSAMNSIEEGKRLMESMAHSEQGKIALRGIQSMCAEFLPLMIRDFTALHPQVKISLGSAICVDVLERILEGKADLGFSSDFDINEEHYQDLERILLKKEEFCIIVSPDHRFAQMEYVNLEDLNGEIMIMPQNTRSRNRIAFEEICQEEGIHPKVAYEVADDSSIMGMVGAGMGVSFMADVPSMHRSDLRAIPIHNLEKSQNQYIVWKKSRRMMPAVTMFRDFVLRMA